MSLLLAKYVRQCYKIDTDYLRTSGSKANAMNRRSMGEVGNGFASRIGKERDYGRNYARSIFRAGCILLNRVPVLYEFIYSFHHNPSVYRLVPAPFIIVAAIHKKTLF